MRGMTSRSQPYKRRGRKGFVRAASMMEQRIRKASEGRGFAVSRVLTHWDDIAGADMASICRPVDVRFGRGNMGATLTILTTGANAPMLEMQKEALRARVNACYGYNAIARIKLTQTAATGFAEGAATFGPAPKATPEKIDPATREAASNSTKSIDDVDLRAALERLGTHVLSKKR